MLYIFRGYGSIGTGINDNRILTVALDVDEGRAGELILREADALHVDLLSREAFKELLAVYIIAKTPHHKGVRTEAADTNSLVGSFAAGPRALSGSKHGFAAVREPGHIQRNVHVDAANNDDLVLWLSMFQNTFSPNQLNRKFCDECRCLTSRELGRKCRYR